MRTFSPRLTGVSFTVMVDFFRLYMRVARKRDYKEKGKQTYLGHISTTGRKGNLNMLTP